MKQIIFYSKDKSLKCVLTRWNTTIKNHPKYSVGFFNNATDLKTDTVADFKKLKEAKYSIQCHFSMRDYYFDEDNEAA